MANQILVISKNKGLEYLVEVKDILGSAIVLAILVYGLMEVDHFFPFKRLLFSFEKFTDYEVYALPMERYYFYYKDSNGKKAKHYVLIDMASIHSDGKIFVKGFDEEKMEHIRFNVNKMSRMYKDETYTRVWYPKEYFKRMSRYGERIRKGKIPKN